VKKGEGERGRKRGIGGGKREEGKEEMESRRKGEGG
jgi:hypothetical protein